MSYELAPKSIREAIGNIPALLTEPDSNDDMDDDIAGAGLVSVTMRRPFV